MDNEIKELTDLITDDLAKIKDQVKEVKENSATTELKEEMTTALEGLKSRLDDMETVSNRLAADHDAGEKEATEIIEHKDAFHDYLVDFKETGLKDLETKALNVSSDPDGGYVASTEMSNRIISTIFETSPLRGIAEIVNTSKKEISYLVDKDEAGAVWTAEQGTNSDTTTPQFAELKIVAHKMETEPAITTELLQDADLDIESWLESKVADKFARTENETFINGNGINKPRGFATYDDGTAWGEIEQIETVASGVLDELDILSLMDLIKDGYLAGSAFFMSRRTNTVLRKLQDANGNFLFTGQDLMNGTLFGYPIVRLEDMDKPTSGVTYAAGTLPIAFGNMKEAYTIVDRLALNVLRDPFTSRSYVKYYTTRRVGGAVTNFEALKLLRIKA